MHKNQPTTDQSVSLPSTAYKLLMRLIQIRISKHTDHLVSKRQWGFRKSKSTGGPIHILRRIQEIFEETKSPLYMLFLDWKQAKNFAKKVIDQFDVRTPGPQSVARSLSGGNLQKFVIGREVLQDPIVLIVNQPTWGVDAAAAASIRQSLLDLAGNGAAIVVISQDLDELIEISTRFAALNAGKLSDTQPMAKISLDEIGLMLGGANAAA